MNHHEHEFPAVRELFREEPGDKIYRVVYASRHQQSGREPDVVLCHIFGSKLEIQFIPITEFRARCMPDYTGKGRLVAVDARDDPYGPFRRNHRATPGNERQSDLNWKRIRDFVNNSALFYRALRSGSDRKNILQDVADKVGLCVQRIRKLHREYLQRGMSASAVAAELWRSGRRHQPPRYVEGGDAVPTTVTRNYVNRPGRKPSRAGSHAVRTTALERLFEQYIDIYLTNRFGPWSVDVSDELMLEIRRFNRDAIFPSTRKKSGKKAGRKSRKRWPKSSKNQAGKRRRLTWQDLVDHLNYVCRCIHIARDPTGQIIELELAPFGIVSLRQLTYYYQTRVPIEVRKMRDMGAKQYAGHGRPIHGHALQHSVGPGNEYMIDATIADIYLVAAYDRTVVVKRPTVYLAMDVWSRMIVGFHVSFDPPSFESVALMLENIALPKNELCARYGIQIDPSLWPCNYLPTSGFVADRGSDFMKNLAWMAVNKLLSIPISNARAWDPTMRALIERRFGILPAHYQSASFGVVDLDAATRGAPRYLWEATLTITEFIKRLVRAILRYNQTPIGRRKSPPEMVAVGLADTPLNRWNWGLETLTGSLRSHSIDEIRCATWPTESAKPTRQGLLWRDMYYTSPFIESNLIHCWGKNSKKTVSIQFNPNDPSQIILPGNDSVEYARLAGTNQQSPAGWTLMEWELYRNQQDRLDREQHHALEAQRVMDLLNNAEENQRARQEQKIALQMAGLEHPTQQERAAARRGGRKDAARGLDFGHFRRERDASGKAADVVEAKREAPKVAEDHGEIIGKALENSRRILDGN
ncbi:hypothetical protein [Paraburkholderia flagellata]|uniref:hypothetical protein n=1 Tax=Paraburkholderia flagellata TaxID=2883241 RepID=UPI001F426D4C|nr:hypothetical protein [Paraburkholderia flagellata]